MLAGLLACFMHRIHLFNQSSASLPPALCTYIGATHVQDSFHGRLSTYESQTACLYPNARYNWPTTLVVQQTLSRQLSDRQRERSVAMTANVVDHASQPQQLIYGGCCNVTRHFSAPRSVPSAFGHRQGKRKACSSTLLLPEVLHHLTTTTRSCFSDMVLPGTSCKRDPFSSPQTPQPAKPSISQINKTPPPSPDPLTSPEYLRSTFVLLICLITTLQRLAGQTFMYYIW